MNHVALRPGRVPGTLDILSICTGGGGLDLGIGLALPGARTVCMVEREAFAVAHLVSAMRQGLLHQAPVWSDAGTFDGRLWRGAVDGLIGGIPCQPHSLAGRKQGSLDHRDLWSDARRIIVQSRCWFVLIENVGGMLAAGADEIAGAERVWRDLRKLGFRVEAGLFTASEIGASHERERVFILGVADDDGGLRQQGGGQGAPRHGQSEFGPTDQNGDVADAGGARSQGREPERVAGSRIEGTTAERGSGALENTQGSGRREGWRLAAVRRLATSSDADRTGRPVGDAAGEGPYAASFAGADRCDGGAGPRDEEPQRRGGDVDDANFAELRQEPSAREFPQPEHQHGEGSSPLFPPGPTDVAGWRETLAVSPELEPAVRRMADGLASGLDLARWHRERVERLRMLGNGVVPLVEAYAIRTLATRAAARGSAGAARLVRMMEAAE
jgi:DNA (cytosine-5)-methyltransferase 1